MVGYGSKVASASLCISGVVILLGLVEMARYEMVGGKDSRDIPLPQQLNTDEESHGNAVTANGPGHHPRISCAKARELWRLGPYIPMPERCLKDGKLGVWGGRLLTKDGKAVGVTGEDDQGEEPRTGPGQANRGYIVTGHELTGTQGLHFPKLSNHKKELAARCYKACTVTKFCKGYTFHPAGGACFLKSSIDGIGGNMCGTSDQCWFWGQVP